jgi:hypothetical protein
MPSTPYTRSRTILRGLRDRRAARRQYREFESAVRAAEAHGGAGDLLAAYRRV